MDDSEASNTNGHEAAVEEHGTVAVAQPETDGPEPSKEELSKKAGEAGWTDTTPFDYAEFQRTSGDNDNWQGAASKYEWKDDYGDVAPVVPELEQILFGGEFLLRSGNHRQRLELPVTIEARDAIAPIKAFEDAGLHPALLRNVQLCQYSVPTPVQAYTIPAIALGHDVVATAQTGSGKTAAYLIPILSKLMGKAKKLAAARLGSRNRAEPLVLIVVPTRELAIQVFDESRRLCYRSMLRPCVAYGGLPMRGCLEDLGKGCDILIGTPGRLCDLMGKPDILSMSRVRFTVIDEADEMLNQDWSEELQMLMTGGDTNEDADHQYMMFSATFPKGARALAREYLEKDHVRIRVGRHGQIHKNIRQVVIEVDQENKRKAMFDLLLASKVGRTLIFCNSKLAVDLLDDFLYNFKFPTTSIHGDRNQREREDAIRAFRTGRTPILIATGVSARGLDIMGIEHVINYDLPSAMHGGIDEYIHRIGRTARMGHEGLATSFYNERNEDIAQGLVNHFIDCECEVPDFLEQYKPEDGQINWDDDSDEEAEAGDAFGGGAEDAGGAATETAWSNPTVEGGNDTNDTFQPEPEPGFAPVATAAAAVATW